jgi:putative sterol carrier protein
MIALTPEWWDELMGRANADKDFKEGMEKWEGCIAILVEPIENLTSEPAIFMADLTGGNAKSMGMVDKEEAEKQKALIKMGYDLFLDLMTGKVIGAKKLIMSGRAEVFGDLVYVLRFVDPLDRFVEIMSSAEDVTLPHTLEGEELEKFKALRG